MKDKDTDVSNELIFWFFLLFAFGLIFGIIIGRTSVYQEAYQKGWDDLNDFVVKNANIKYANGCSIADGYNFIDKYNNVVEFVDVRCLR